MPDGWEGKSKNKILKGSLKVTDIIFFFYYTILASVFFVLYDMLN